MLKLAPPQPAPRSGLWFQLPAAFCKEVSKHQNTARVYFDLQLFSDDPMRNGKMSVPNECAYEIFFFFYHFYLLSFFSKCVRKVVSEINSTQLEVTELSKVSTSWS